MFLGQKVRQDLVWNVMDLLGELASEEGPPFSTVTVDDYPER
jgi:hypothetical protein